MLYYVICFVFFLRILRPPISTRTDTRFPYTSLFRSVRARSRGDRGRRQGFGFPRPDPPHRHLPNWPRRKVADGTTDDARAAAVAAARSEEHTSELQSLMRISYAVFCLKKKNKTTYTTTLRRYNQKT